MATVPTPASATVNKKVTAAAFNAGVRDPLTFLLSGKPVAHVTQDAAQSAFAASTWTSITFPSEVVDLDSQHSTSSNTSRVLIGNTLGYYLVCGVVCWATNNTGNSRRSRIALNGSPVLGSFGKAYVGDGAVVTSVTPMVVVQSTVSTDYVELQGYHDAGSSIGTVSTSEARSSLTVVYLGAN